MLSEGESRKEREKLPRVRGVLNGWPLWAVAGVFYGELTGKTVALKFLCKDC